MFYYFVLLILGPLLIIQGRLVRKNIPILAEATGGRSGRLGEGRPLTLLVVGDSAAAGVGVETQDDALSGCLTRVLAQKYCVDWSLVAKSGNTTEDLIKTLQGRPFQTDSLSMERLQAKVLDDNNSGDNRSDDNKPDDNKPDDNKPDDNSSAGNNSDDNWLDNSSAPDIDVVLVSLGVNDLLSPIRESQWITQQVRLIKLLKSKFSAKHILMTAVPPMHCFPAFPQPLRWFLGLRASEFNRKLVSLIELESECELVIIPLMPIASDMASDGFHPSEKIYRLWGGTAATAIEKRIESLQRVKSPLNR
ncbi:SGNH/GDSL hydrolase family protein [Shewanella sp.]|uniref:SGNH/GDSL hydrolase family protein n=1 Tax=Shewanella sp. TaxID=50422 RepID=UPI001ED66716|nr:SGNH/GDSL hydrolase family protein [Shewanella sp.]NRB24005.1 SGNH/GDSL hydrolase family protein [Shewanella sp.]